jgi:hypothetical protein
MMKAAAVNINELTQEQANILSVYLQSSEMDKVTGRAWYSQAYQYTTRLAAKYNCEIPAVAGVIAALSPNTRWETNVHAAEELVKAYTYDIPLTSLALPCYKANVLKAWSIINGESPLDVLGGNKVRSFYACIMGSKEDVCVDGHAYSIWYGRRLSMKQVPRLSDKIYKTVSDDYKKVASLLDITPYILQATTWVTWRRMHNV